MAMRSSCDLLLDGLALIFTGGTPPRRRCYGAR
jgi:hypothetical protein